MDGGLIAASDDVHAASDLMNGKRVCECEVSRSNFLLYTVVNTCASTRSLKLIYVWCQAFCSNAWLG